MGGSMMWESAEIIGLLVTVLAISVDSFGSLIRATLSWSRPILLLVQFTGAVKPNHLVCPGARTHPLAFATELWCWPRALSYTKASG